MKRLLLFSVSLIIFLGLQGQAGRADILQDLERKIEGNQVIPLTAVMKSAGRLFADPNDLTSVILIIPKDSVVNVLVQDTDHLYVDFQGYEGYIRKNQAVINEPPVQARQQLQQQVPVAEEQPVQQQVRSEISRFAYLESKYGSSMAARLDAGKIWKGMTTEMVQDSWGTPQKINRVISGNNIREEWIYRNSWLFFENDRLIEWGPVRR